MPELPPNTYIWPLQTAPAAPHVAAGMFCLYCQLKSSGTAVLPVPFEKISVIDDDVEFWLGLASLACTVMVLVPGLSVKVSLQKAIPCPLAVSLLAGIPLTVTDEIPLSPRPESEAEPESVIVFV